MFLCSYFVNWKSRETNVPRLNDSSWVKIFPFGISVSSWDQIKGCFVQLTATFVANSYNIILILCCQEINNIACSPFLVFFFSYIICRIFSKTFSVQNIFTEFLSHSCHICEKLDLSKFLNRQMEKCRFLQNRWEAVSHN